MTMTQPDVRTALAPLVEQPEQGTIFMATIHKMGEVRGGKVYDDDVKEVLIWTGFSYRALVQRSMRILTHQLNAGNYIGELAKATLEEHGDTTIEDVCEALQEIRNNFRKILNSELSDSDDILKGSHYWSPLRINGTTVRGSYLYTGQARPENPRAPVPGTIYVRGLKLGERVVTSAPNGKWVPDSRPKTLAKKIITERLPIGLYCQYRLEPSRISGVAVADAAVAQAKEKRIAINPGALTSLFKVG